MLTSFLREDEGDPVFYFLNYISHKMKSSHGEYAPWRELLQQKGTALMRSVLSNRVSNPMEYKAAHLPNYE